MNKALVYLLCFSMITSTSFAAGDLNEQKEATDSLWRRGAGAEDGAFTAISASMLGWGVGLAAVIAILASVLHQSSSSSGAHAHAHTCP